MPGSTNFLVFNPTDVANTQDDATYTAETQRTGGLQNGIAKTAMHNKLFRQVTVMVAAIAQYMANQGQTVSDADASALTTVIQNSFAQRGATALDTGIDANTYVWQNGVYTCTANVANMPIAGHTWIVKAAVADANNVYLYAIDLTSAGSYYVREKIAGVWQAWVSQAFALQSDLATHEAENATQAHGGLILGTLNTDLNKIKALSLKTDTRTTTLTYTSGALTSVVDADGATTVKTTTLNYTSGVLTSVSEVAGGTTVTTTLNYTSGVLTSVTKAVS